ncbi:MAG: fumarylacetoacetate hydrolase family protein [Candidatus Limnocylindrales bacterium]
MYPTGYTDMLDLIKDGSEGVARARKTADSSAAIDVDRLLAPLRPGKIFGTGINWRTHVRENPSFVVPDEPIVTFIKAASAVIGPGDPIVLPPHDRVIKRPGGFHAAYEVEFGVVMGRPARNIRQEEALDYVFGYTIFNDVTAEAISSRGNNQLMLSKNFDTFCPMGPCIVTKDEIPVVAAAHLRCWVNGSLRQDAYLADQISPPEVLIEWLTAVATLEPGDCITTGTPPGAEFWRTSPRWLQGGDVVVCKEDTIGELVNPVIGA